MQWKSRRNRESLGCRWDSLRQSHALTKKKKLLIYEEKGKRKKRVRSRMLLGLRRKIGRYAPIGGVKEAPEEGGEQEQRLKENATPLEAAVWHFARQDRALRRLETEMTQMLDQIQVKGDFQRNYIEFFLF